MATEAAHRFATPSGLRTIDGEAIVRLWHPAMSSTDEIGTLRAFARSLDLVQPFRQVWRETYVPNTAERSMELYSSHYAGHILRFRQFYALARERGWWGGFLSGAWDGGQSGIANRDFRVAGIRASWQLAMLDFDDHRIEIELGVTDRLIFAQIGENEQAPLALSDVPSVVFSEAMRDLDLFTSVCTVANDPFWIEKFAFEPRLGEYWEALAHGEHLDAVHHRRELLEAMVKDGNLPEQFELADRHLVVRGTLRTYSIDLATGNVRMDPPGKWLSFSGKATNRIDSAASPSAYLPAIDDDEILRRILIRSRLLADDDLITERSLRSQIRDQ